MRVVGGGVVYKKGNAWTWSRWGYEVELDGSKKDIDQSILEHMAIYRFMIFSQKNGHEIDS